MKKKLKINQLKVQSFITSPNRQELQGGGTLLNCLPGTETMYSCLAYVSCHILDCIANTHEECIRTTDIQVQTLSVCP